MGLDTSHDAWHGSYTTFGVWREWLAEQIGVPLALMEGFYEKGRPGMDPFSAVTPLAVAHLTPPHLELYKQILTAFPLKWELLQPRGLLVLLNHSDCDGDISPTDCFLIAEELKTILAGLQPENRWFDRTKKFMEGCELAASKNETLEFH